MLELYLLPVLSGCIIPFFIKDDDKKEKMIDYGFVLASMIVLAVLVLSDMGGIPSYGKPESIGIGVALIILAVSISKLKRLVGEAHSTIHHVARHQQHKKAS